MLDSSNSELRSINRSTDIHPQPIQIQHTGNLNQSILIKKPACLRSRLNKPQRSPSPPSPLPHFATLWSSTKFGLPRGGGAAAGATATATAAASPTAGSSPKKPKQQPAGGVPAEEQGAFSAPASVFDAAPLELERAMDALSVSSTAMTTPLPPLPPLAASPASSSPSQQQDVAFSTPSRLLSSLPSYLLPAFLGGGGRGTFKPLKQHTVRASCLSLIHVSIRPPVASTNHSPSPTT